MLMRRVSIAFLVATAALVATMGSAGAATQVGQTFKPSVACSANTTFLQAVSPIRGGGGYTVPTPGVLTTWSYVAPDGATGGVKLKVARRSSTTDFRVVGESPLQIPAPGVVNTYGIQIPVRGGEVIGLYQTLPNPCATPQTRYQLFSSSGDVAPGTTAAFSGPELQRLDVSAILEPDCDADGLGDQTQDNDTSTCATCKGKRATIVGTSGTDVLGGTPGRDVMVGFAGSDRLSGFAGNDLLCGGKGNDKLFGGKGRDRLQGQKGKDKLNGGGGKDFCIGGKGRDSASKCEKQKSI
jgi:hypothetical protein